MPRDLAGGGAPRATPTGTAWRHCARTLSMPWPRRRGRASQDADPVLLELARLRIAKLLGNTVELGPAHAPGRLKRD